MQLPSPGAHSWVDASHPQVAVTLFMLPEINDARPQICDLVLVLPMMGSRVCPPNICYFGIEIIEVKATEKKQIQEKNLRSYYLPKSRTLICRGVPFPTLLGRTEVNHRG